MKKILKYYFTILMVLALGACNSSDEQSDPSVQSDDYCLIFYISGGDPEHDKVFDDYKESIIKKLPDSNVAVTWLMLPSSGAGAVTRSYSSGNTFETDKAWNPATDYSVTQPSSLTEFIDWSAQMFPGRKYILITGGHGNIWDPTTDDPQTRGLMYDFSGMMTSTDLSRAIENSSVQIDALITNNCLQGCIETLSEWQDCVPYCVCSVSYLPDMGGDYPYLMSLLDRKMDIRNVVTEYVRHIGTYLIEYGGAGTDSDIAICAIDMSRIKDINETLKHVFAEMGTSLERISTQTDYPCVAGRSYVQGYIEARDASMQVDVIYNQLATTDLYDFLKNAVVYTGHIELISLVAKSFAAYDDAILMSARSSKDNGHLISFCILTNRVYYDYYIDIYRRNRFDQQTGWSALYEKILAAEKNGKTLPQ